MRKIIKLEGLCCANCASKIETEVSRLKGVTNASLSFMTQRLTMEVEEDKVEEVLNAARKAAYNIEPEAEFKVLR